MVRFSELKHIASGKSGEKADAVSDVEAGAAPPASAEPLSERTDIYEDASFYLSKVFTAVKEGRPFALDPGFRIMHQVVEAYSPQDKLFIKAIQLDDRLNYLINKCVNVAIYAVRLAEQLGYAKERQVEIGMAGLLHEVGMCRIPEKILYKKEQLTRKEFEIIQQHSEFGYEILKPFGDKYPYLAETALQVHERIDGSGYPRGLKGDEIHEYAQIVGLVDIYEALSHSRPQRDRFNHFYAIKEIIKTCKTKFHKKHLKALLNAFSIFPLSTYVRLNSNAVGRVIETYPDQPMRPKLQIVYDSQGRRVLTERIVNLPENSLLFIVDSVSEDQIESLEQGFGLQPSPRAFEERDVAKEAAIGPQPENENENENSTPPPEKKKKRKWSRGGARPMLALLLLLILFGSIPYWQGRQPVSPSSASNTGVKEPSAAVQERIQISELQPDGRTIENDRIVSEKIDITAESKLEEHLEPKSTEIETESIGQIAGDETENRLGESLGHAGGHDDALAALNWEYQPPEPDSPKLSRVPQRPQQPSQDVKTGEQKDLSPNLNVKSEGTLPETRGQRPYSVLLASFKTLDRAERAMAVYRSKGVSPYRVKVDLGEDGIWHRIFNGHYKTFSEAKAAAARMPSKEALVKKTRFAALVGTYLETEAAETERNRLNSLGYTPYIVDQDNGRIELFVGAFFTRKGAEDKAEELFAKGVQARVVAR